jgi:hypothetical protein
MDRRQVKKIIQFVDALAAGGRPRMGGPARDRR